MSYTSRTDVEHIREQAAAQEREAILEIVERHMRQLAHGHGVTGVQALQHIVTDIQRREGTSPASRW